jgi:hypothetical protein
MEKKMKRSEVKESVMGNGLFGGSNRGNMTNILAEFCVWKATL